jgi:hypothetical protein
MRASRSLLFAIAVALPAAPALACPEDGGYHYYFAFASQLQDMQSRSGRQDDQSSRPDEQSRTGSRSSQSDDGNGQQPPPDQSPQEGGSGPADAMDAATFR